MLKKRNNLLICNATITQISLVIFSIFAFAFIIGEADFASAQRGPRGPVPATPPEPPPPKISYLGTPSSTNTLGGTLGTSQTFTVAESFTAGGEVFAVGEEVTLASFTPTGGGPSQWMVNGKHLASLNEGAKISALDGAPQLPQNTAQSGNFLGDIINGNAFEGQLGGVPGHLISGLAWGVAAAGITYMIAGALGASDSQAEAAAIAVGVGVAVGRFGFLQAGGGVASGIQQGSGPLADLFTSLKFGTGTGAFLWTVGISAAIFVLTYKEEEQKRVEYQCLPFEAPTGGDSCEVCNDDEFRPCSEYRCRSLGQACELVNSGTVEEKCVWINPGDVTSPTITPWDDALTGGHSYTSPQTRPPALGTRIVRNSASDGCIAAFTPLEFGFITNEPAQCKADIVHQDNLEAMTYFFGESNFYLEEHEQRITLPSPDALAAEGLILENDGIYDVFVRCQDKNGNENVEEYAFSFCVDPSPDTTPPLIVDTSIPTGNAVKAGIGEIEIEVYTNEPAQCKWSIQDKNFNDMETSMICVNSVRDLNAQEVYTCTTTLTGIKDRQENQYFFRCEDSQNKPVEDRNINTQSYEYILRGTQELNIIDVSPKNETISDSTGVVDVDLRVETSNGADEGVAVCSFSSTGDEGSYIIMFETDAFAHKQTLSLTEGDYNYFFRCVDAGGNSDESEVSFKIEVDNEAPLITRAYRELDALKVITNEDASCAYSLNSCNYNFDDGLVMQHRDVGIRNQHVALWQPNIVYYIKCRDEFGNEPSPDQCSLIASATNIN